ncbi:restriction endonuclease subunit S [Methanocalculus taiwanensis]|uniref:Restriction endonuclease subunit S n=1 Tax=Methanocalculus taiwanensis TaxID=106207 RepID=A0ABD4TJD8_9EURY|nr:restriction endonuclease subunit S [Methanocalculus taiwanensis]MCQ1537465.1 restriction endonuclease subunit S [Methanocalculus taiwanensis]
MGECPIGWKRVPIIDLCAKHTDCVNRTAPIVDYETPYKMIRTSNIKNGFIDCENVRYVTEEIFKKWTRRLIPKMGDIILTREAPLGDVGKIRTEDSIFLGQRLYHFRVNPNYLNEDFLLYSLLADDLQGQIQGFGSGATVEHMRLADIPNLTINIPPIKVQNKIATILSAYDDLIENNTRRIKILEEMAQNLYREWFVKFRFPGHEHARFVDSPLGQIPEGWEVKSMLDIVEVRPRIPVPKSEEIIFVPMGSLAENSMLIEGFEIRDKPSGARFQNGDTLFARITPCLENGKTGFVQFLPTDDTIACGSTEFIVLRSKTACPEYVYLMSRSDTFRDHAIKSMTGATGRQRVTEKCFEQYTLAQPPESVLKQFQDIVQPQFNLIYSLNRENQNLRTTRDLLLPKLISGEVDVSDLNIRIPEAAMT